MMQKYFVVAAVVWLCAMNGARADQCAWINVSQAEKAKNVLLPGTAYLMWCEPCGEAQPTLGLAERIDTYSADWVKDGYSQSHLNFQEVDLAYLYIAGKDHRFENAAKLVGCPTEDVKPWFIPDQDAAGADNEPPRTYPIKDLSGKWKVKFRNVSSTCKYAKPGDSSISIWTLGITKGKLIVKVAGSIHDPSRYEGVLENRGHSLTLTAEDTDANPSEGAESVVIRLTEPFGTLRGTRVDKSRESDCEVRSNVEMRKD